MNTGIRVQHVLVTGELFFEYVTNDKIVLISTNTGSYKSISTNRLSLFDDI